MNYAACDGPRRARKAISSSRWRVEADHWTLSPQSITNSGERDSQPRSDAGVNGPKDEFFPQVGGYRSS